MSRYIDADLLDFPDRYIKAANAKASLHNYFRGLHFEQMCVAIDETPSADVVEVRHGHWIYIDKVRPECPDDSDCYYECSECHAGDAHNKRVQVPYCWHCGARMDGEEE